MQRFRLIDTQLHGVPSDSVPTITPEIARQLADESYKVRTAFRKRIVKMWKIPASERRKRCRSPLTPEVIAAAHAEMEEVRADVAQELKDMWTISTEQWYARSK